MDPVRPGSAARNPLSPRHWPVLVRLVAALALVIGLASACAPPPAEQLSLPSGDPAFALLNQLRIGQGVPPLARSGELDVKAQAQAQRMADAGTIFHSSDLRAGISPGWRMVGENVAMAQSVPEAQDALEHSPPHMRNMLNPAFNQAGVGVVESGGMSFVVQIFVQR